MARDMNPFGVGATGESFEWGFPRCNCCQLRFRTKIVKGIPISPICNSCVEHAPEHEESIDSLNARLLSHQALHLNKIRDITEKMDQTWEENKTLKDQTRAALISRDRWREILDRVSALHGETLEGHTCQCGHKWPCETWQALNSNEGISRQLRSR